MNEKYAGTDDEKLNAIIHEMREDMILHHKGTFTKEHQEALEKISAFEQAVRNGRYWEAMKMFPKYAKAISKAYKVEEAAYLTSEEKEIIENAYKIPKKPTVNGSGELNEKVSENTRFRSYVSRQHNNVTGDDLDAVIEKMSDDEVLDVLSTNNSYGMDYRKYIEENPKKKAQMIKNIKKAWIKVGMFIGAASSLPTISTSEE